MPVFSFQLSASSPFRSITLRELNGHDEFLITDTGTLSALELLNNIIVQKLSDNSNTQILLKAEKITITDRDYLLARIYKNVYGSRIESSLNCNSCGELYDLNFSLDDLIINTGNRKTDMQPNSEGFFCNDNGLLFRLPNGEDELAVWGLPAGEAELLMFDRCVAQTVTKESKQIMEVMEELGPVLTTDLSANCPECGSVQSVQFDMQSYLLTKLKNERKKLVAEIHSIALAYSWSHKEILDLPRSLREAYTGLINQN